MNKLSRDDLWSLEEYSAKRQDFRAEIIKNKKVRQVALSDNARLYFENRLTIQYQIQEMLRIERIFEAPAIEEELDSYNPLIPDGSNWKATFMIEYDDPEERKIHLSRLVGVEDKVWAQVEGCDKVYGIADEDMERSREEKTSAVHFMRFELSADMVRSLKSGTALSFGIDHPYMTLAGEAVSADTRDELSADLDDIALN